MTVMKNQTEFIRTLNGIKRLFGRALILCIILTSSCTTLKRYDSVQSSGTDNNLASIDLFGFSLSKPEPDTDARSLWDLGADAQTQFIKILNSRYPDNDSFINAMNLEYVKTNGPSANNDYLHKDLRMVFSVSKRRGFGMRNSPPGYSLSSADRIEYLRISLKIPDQCGVKFTGWNMFTTEYGTIKIADVSFSKSLQIDATGLINAGTKVTTGELSAGGKKTSERKEDQGIQYRYLKLNGRINSNRIEMEEEGTREIDLTGNILADVSLEFDNSTQILTRISGLKDSTGRFNRPERLVIAGSETPVPGIENIKDTIFADLRMDYVFRNVLRGQKTFPEWDDKVKYVTGSVAKRIMLLRAGDYLPELYCIGTGLSDNKMEILRLMNSGRTEHAAIFRSKEEATSFYDWLADYFSKPADGKELRIGEYVVKLNDRYLTADNFTSNQGLKILPFYQCQSDCSRLK